MSYEPGWNPYYADRRTQEIEARWADEDRIAEAADSLAEQMALATLADQSEMTCGEYDHALRVYGGDAAAMDAELAAVEAGAEPSHALLSAFTAANMGTAFGRMTAQDKAEAMAWGEP
jgi:hypothetical protein